MCSRLPLIITKKCDRIDTNWQLANGDSLNAAHIQEVNQIIIMGLEALADDIKRRLNCRFLKIKLMRCRPTNRVCLAETDKATFAWKSANYYWRRKRVPSGKKLAVQQEELSLWKRRCATPPELQAILSHLETCRHSRRLLIAGGYLDNLVRTSVYGYSRNKPI